MRFIFKISLFIFFLIAIQVGTLDCKRWFDSRVIFEHSEWDVTLYCCSCDDIVVQTVNRLRDYIDFCSFLSFFKEDGIDVHIFAPWQINMSSYPCCQDRAAVLNYVCKCQQTKNLYAYIAAGSLSCDQNVVIEFLDKSVIQAIFRLRHLFNQFVYSDNLLEAYWYAVNTGKFHMLKRCGWPIKSGSCKVGRFLAHMLDFERFYSNDLLCLGSLFSMIKNRYAMLNKRCYREVAVDMVDGEGFGGEDKKELVIDIVKKFASRFDLLKKMVLNDFCSMGFSEQDVLEIPLVKILAHAVLPREQDTYESSVFLHLSNLFTTGVMCTLIQEYCVAEILAVLFAKWSFAKSEMVVIFDTYTMELLHKVLLKIGFRLSTNEDCPVDDVFDL